MINELPEINVPQSIRQGKLVYYLKGWSWFSYLESRIGIMICLGLLIAWVIFYYDVAFADIVSILLIGLMIANLLTINKLVKVDRRLYAISEDKIVSV